MTNLVQFKTPRRPPPPEAARLTVIRVGTDYFAIGRNPTTEVLFSKSFTQPQET